MKNFLALMLIVFILLGLSLAVASFLGRDVLTALKTAATRVNLAGNPKLGKVIVKFAVISDTHSDSSYTQKAVEQARAVGAEYIVHTGDWTTVGTENELSEQKDIFDQIGLPYWGIMGDHDRWQSKTVNFTKIIGPIYRTFEREGLQHILLDASDLKNGLGAEQLSWLKTTLEESSDKPKLIFMHLPPYHPTSERTVSLKGGKDQTREEQVKEFLDLIQGKKVKMIFAGDHHFSSNYTEPKTSVKIRLVGAAVSERNLQRPRFDLVQIDEKYNISVQEQVIKDVD